MSEFRVFPLAFLSLPLACGGGSGSEPTAPPDEEMPTDLPEEEFWERVEVLLD